MKKRSPRPELQDGRTFYDFSLCSGEYVGKAQTRKAIMAALRDWSSIEGLRTSAQRKHVADHALADTRFLTSCSGQVVTAVARDVVDAFLRGRWSALDDAAADAREQFETDLAGGCLRNPGCPDEVVFEPEHDGEDWSW